MFNKGDIVNVKPCDGTVKPLYHLWGRGTVIGMDGKLVMVRLAEGAQMLNPEVVEPVVSMGLPKLVECVEEWAADRDLLGKDPIRQTLKLYEEAGELASALFRMDPDGDSEHLADAMDAIGDMTVVLTILARQLGTTLETCLDMAYDEIKDRKGITTVNGFIKEADL